MSFTCVYLCERELRIDHIVLTFVKMHQKGPSHHSQGIGKAKHKGFQEVSVSPEYSQDGHSFGGVCR